jgi:mono/diheme cytochrome c family protein
MGEPEPSNGEVTPEALGISFSPGSTSTLRIDRNGRAYEVDLAKRTIRDIGLSAQTGNKDPGNPIPDTSSEGASLFMKNCATCHGADAKGAAGMGTPDFTSATTQARLKTEQIVSTIENGRPGTMMPAWANKLSEVQILSIAAYLRSLAPNSLQGQGTGQPSTAAGKVYQPGDDNLFSLPTGRRPEVHGLYVNFAHRFAFDPAFSGVARGYALLGLDGFSLSSFGLRYGVTKNFSVSLYRSPTFISRPIQMMGAYNFLSESDGAPLNVAGRLSIEGQNDFDRNFAGSIEIILSRSLSRHAQFYFVPTVSVGARHLFSPDSYVSSAIPNLPGYTTVSTGVGGALDIRPTVALVAEVIPTLLNGAPLGIHRAAYAFGIQKKIWRHAFTFGFTTAPATTVSQRAATAAALLNNPEADEPRGLFIGFNLTRKLF